MEIWKEVKLAPKYEVSNLGNIRKNQSKTLLKPYEFKGYMKIKLQTDTGRKPFRVSRLVAEAFLPDFVSEKLVDHINQVRNDNRVENLRVVSHKENCANKVNKVEYIQRIIKLYEKGLSIEEIEKTASKGHFL